MDRQAFVGALACARQVVSAELSAKGVRDSWLNGIDVILQSKFYLESVYQDLCLFEKYLPADPELLDLGTGAGYISLFLAGERRHIKAIDYDDFAEQLDQAATHKEMANQQKSIWSCFHQKYPNVAYSHYDGTHIPFGDATFDAVLAYAVLEHVRDGDVPQVMREIRRVLRPGGYLFIAYLPRKYSYAERLCAFLNLGHHERLYGDGEIKQLLAAYDLKILNMAVRNMIPAYPAGLTNAIFPVFRYVDALALMTPLRYVGHNLRIVCKKT